jgi:hypothetical protein
MVNRFIWLESLHFPHVPEWRFVVGPKDIVIFDNCLHVEIGVPPFGVCNIAQRNSPKQLNFYGAAVRSHNAGQRDNRSLRLFVVYGNRASRREYSSLGNYVEGTSGAVVRKNNIFAFVIWPRIFPQFDPKRVSVRQFKQQPSSLLMEGNFYALVGGVRTVLSGFGSIAGDAYRFLQYSTLYRHFSYLFVHRPQLPIYDLALFLHGVPLPSHFMPCPRHLVRLAAIDKQLQEHDSNLQNSYNGERACKPYQFPLNFPVFFTCIVIGFVCMVPINYGLEFICRSNLSMRGLGSKRGRWGWLLSVIGIVGLGSALSTVGLGSPFALWRFRWLLGEDDHCNEDGYFHSGQSVSQKDLTSFRLCNTFSDMANVLSGDKQTAIIAALAEGSSIRSIERITGIHCNTIMRLGVMGA